MAHIFISYSTKDAAYAYRLADDLQARGFNVWIDNAKLRSSENWWESIVRALRAADAVVVIMSPHSRESRWVQREVTLADNWGKPTFPLLLDGENFEIFVLTQYADVTDNNLPNQQWYERLAIESPPDITAGTRVTQDTVPIKDDSLIREAVANPPEADEIVQSPAPSNNVSISKTIQAETPAGNISKRVVAETPAPPPPKLNRRLLIGVCATVISLAFAYLIFTLTQPQPQTIQLSDQTYVIPHTSPDMQTSLDPVSLPDANVPVFARYDGDIFTWYQVEIIASDGETNLYWISDNNVVPSSVPDDLLIWINTDGTEIVTPTPP